MNDIGGELMLAKPQAGRAGQAMTGVEHGHNNRERKFEMMESSLSLVQANYILLMCSCRATP